MRLLAVIAWPAAALIRRRYAARLELTKQQAYARRLTGVAAIINLLFLLGWTVLVQSGLSNLSLFDGRLDAAFFLLHLLGFVGVLGAGAAIWNAWLSLQGPSGWWSRTWSVVLAASCVAITWIGFTLNLIKFDLYY